MKLGPNKSRTLSRKLRDFPINDALPRGYYYNGFCISDLFDEEFESLYNKKWN